MRSRRKKSRKRLNGEGSIYQRKDGLWCGEISLANGKRKALYGKTAEIVRAKLKAALDAKAKGTLVADERVTVGDHLDTFLKERSSRTRPQTMQHYRNSVERHIKPKLGHIRLTNLTPLMVLQFLDEKRSEVIGKKADGSSRHLAPLMIRHIRTVLKMALELAVDLDLIARNPVRKLKSGRDDRKKINPLDADETRRFLTLAGAHSLGAIWLIVATLGLRRGEVLGLRWEDIDLEKSELRVRVQLMHLHDDAGELKPVLVEPKSKNALRDLKLVPALVDALRARKADQAAERLQLGEEWGPDLGLVFTTHDGRPLQGGAVSSTHSALCKKAQVRHIRFHDLRHGAATAMLEAGVDPRTLSDALGHSRVGFTLDTYAHVRKPRLDDAIERVAERLLPGNPSRSN